MTAVDLRDPQRHCGPHAELVQAVAPALRSVRGPRGRPGGIAVLQRIYRRE